MNDEVKNTGSRDPDDEHCLVVGIGASAGGLEAFKRFLGAVPHRSGLAFVLIQHLDPTHQSMMADLLGKQTAMTVVEAHNAMVIEPDHVYVIPPGKFIKIADDGLFLDEPVQKRGLRMPIDYFFRSLAAARQERAIGVILSGTGSDGSQGLKAIKSVGGMVMAEDPGTAAYPGMPRAAVATGMVDFVMSVAELPAALIDYAEHPYLDGAERPLIADTAPEHFQSILNLLRAHTEYDFRCYKKGTVSRRIQRRMGLQRVDALGDYLAKLRADPDEVRRLFKDLLIGVTHFFRDREAWTLLDEEVIDQIVSHRDVDKPVRVWVPGCATGEEAYSLAMQFYEAFDRKKTRLDLQIFATDLDAEAIEFARGGLYPGNIAADVSAHRLSRFFVEHGDTYKVNKRMRGSVVFAVQNLISDPPFSNLDLISCRNLLIYLENGIQQRLLETFHFSLAPGGYLFLGNSESVGQQGRLFHQVSKAWRMYRKKGNAVIGSGVVFPIGRGPEAAAHRSRAAAVQRTIGGDSETDRIRRFMVEVFAPASVVIGPDFTVYFMHGPVRDYLDFPSGEATQNLLKMAIEGLRPKIRLALQATLDQKEPASIVARRVRRNGRLVAIRVTVRLLPGPRENEQRYLVAFEDEPSVVPPAPAEKSPAKPSTKGDDDADATDEETDDAAMVEHLEYELQTTREDLQSTIEELETSNEELKASNEEVMSMNEELQSTNEELETSREELQSLNEELNTVNRQLEEKVEEVEASSNDLNNLISSSDVATVFLDTEFCIRRFTGPAAELLHVREGDVGRPFIELAPGIEDPGLIEDSRRVLRRLIPEEREVSGGGRWHMRRVLPYRTSDNQIAGVVVTYADITSVKNWANRIEVRESQQAAVARLGQLGLDITDSRQFLTQVAKVVAKTLGSPLVEVLEQESGSGRLRLRAGVGWHRGQVGRSRRPAGRGSLPGYTITTAAPVVSSDLRVEKRFELPNELKRKGAESGMAVLVGTADVPWGVISVYDHGGRDFDADDVNFLQAVANLTHATLENLRSSEALRRDAHRIALVHEAAITAAETDSLDEALQRCLDIICRLTSWSVGHVYTLEKEGLLESGRLWRLPEDNRHETFRQVTEKMRFQVGDDSLPGQAAGSGQVYWISDIQDDTRFQRSHPDITLKGAMAFPIMVRNEPVAVVEFFHEEKMRLDDEFVRTIQTLAEQFGRIFERRTAHEYRLRIQDSLQMIVQAAGVGVWEWEVETDRSHWNDQMFELLDLDPNTPASGERFFKSVHPEDREGLRQAVDRVVKEGRGYEHVFRIVLPNGRFRWLDARGKLVRDSEGKPLFMRGVNMDITRQKMVEEDLYRVNQTLEDRVAERSAVADQRAERLRGMRMRLNEVEERERQRVARLLHDDLQQMLVASLMRLNRIDAPDDNLPVCRDLLEQALRSCRSLVSELRPPAMRDGSAREMVRWLSDHFRKQHGLNVEIELPDQAVSLGMGEQTVMFRAAQELLFNVVKHAQVKDARLRLGLEDEQAVLEVADSGRGFTAGQEDAHGGYGLLNISEQIESIGGTLHVENDPEGGVRALMTIPTQATTEVMIATETRDTDAITAEAHPAVEPREGRDLRVVVADDHQVVRESIVGLVKGCEGVEVVGEAGDGAEALEAAREFSADVVLMDVNMPVLNGIEATHRLSAEFPHIAVIGLSIRDETIESALREAGAVDFVAKEEITRDLPEALRRLGTRGNC